MGLSAASSERLVRTSLTLASILLLGYFALETVRASALGRNDTLRIAERGNPPSAELSLQGVRVTSYPAAQGQALVLRGYVRNDSAAPKPLPTLRLSLIRLKQPGAIGAPVVARLAPDVCELAETLSAREGQAQARDLLADVSNFKQIEAYSSVPIFTYVRDDEEAGPGWLTIDWL